MATINSGESYNIPNNDTDKTQLNTDAVQQPAAEVQPEQPGIEIGQPVNYTGVDTTNQCTINNTETPILVLFGPSQCGKSMTMVRLVNYLREQGYNCNPRHDFRPSTDVVYAQRCGEFNNTIATYKPLPGTPFDDYMLVEVSNGRGDSVLQILEAPGEHYFSLVNADPVNAPYPAYLAKIQNCNAPKIWCFFIEPNWTYGHKCGQYVERIKNARSFINLRKDKIIILFNKVDTMPQFMSFNHINIKAVTQFANQQYPGLFNAFKDNTLLGKITGGYLCQLIPFSTGSYDPVAKTYTVSKDMYPDMLCKALKL